jgi:hypothetical protein
MLCVIASIYVRRIKSHASCVLFLSSLACLYRTDLEKDRALSY